MHRIDSMSMMNICTVHYEGYYIIEENDFHTVIVVLLVSSSNKGTVCYNAPSLIWLGGASGVQSEKGEGPSLEDTAHRVLAVVQAPRAVDVAWRVVGRGWGAEA